MWAVLVDDKHNKVVDAEKAEGAEILLSRLIRGVLCGNLVKHVLWNIRNYTTLWAEKRTAERHHLAETRAADEVRSLLTYLHTFRVTLPHKTDSKLPLVDYLPCRPASTASTF